jgi:hypothetical protein
MNQAEIEAILTTDWLKDAPTTTAFQEAHDAFMADQNEHILDWDRIQNERDVGSLMYQVVGRETH